VGKGVENGLCERLIFKSGFFCSTFSEVMGVKTSRLHGFTLVESLFVIAVLGILLAVAVPSLSGFGHGTRLSAYSNHFLATLLLARSEAIKRNARVAICKSRDGQSCSSEGPWSQGWIVFSDPNNNAQIDPGEHVLLIEAALPENWVVAGNTPVAKYVSYSGAGSSHLMSGAFQAGSITICRKTTAAAMSSRIIINSAGRPRTVREMLPSCS